MKAGWEVKPLGNVYDVRDGTHDSPKYHQEGYPLITSKNLKPNGLNFEKVKYISKEDYLAINRRSGVHKGDLLFAMIGTIGIPTVVEVEPDFAIKNVALMKAPDSQDVHFLKYYLETRFVIEKMKVEAKGATQKFVGLGYLRNFSIPLPPLDEQKRIVAVLDAAFDGLTRARANVEANLQNARELFESERDRIFEEGPNKIHKTLNEVCSKFEYGTSEKSKPVGEIPVLRMGNLQDGAVDWDNLVYSNNQDDFKRLSLRKGDVLFNRTNSVEHVGKTSIIESGRQAIFAGYLIRVHPIRELLNPYYLNYFLNSSQARRYGKSIMGKSVNQANISGSKLKTYPIFIPSINEQEKAVLKLRELKQHASRLQANYRTKLADLDELRQSLLQKAFAGELT